MVNDLRNKDSKLSKLKKILFKPDKIISPNVIEYSSLGIQIALTILVFLFLGLWLDGKLGTKFIFTLVFTIFGFVGVFYKLIITVKELERKKRENKNDK